MATQSLELPSPTIIYAFRGSPDGAVPKAGVVADGQGRLYGTTELGGLYGFGAVFRLTPPLAGQTLWTEEILYNFRLADGVNPIAPVALGSDGSIYGTTSDGGPSGRFGRGTVFLLSPEGSYSVLHAFGGRDGSSPNTGVLFGSDGLLYGTTPGPKGTIFSISPLGDQVEYEVRHVFAGGGSGINPVGLTAVSFENFQGFVGATMSGPAAGGGTGTVYTYQTAAGGTGVERILYSFPASSLDQNVGMPSAPPITAAFGGRTALYGCAGLGGAVGHGGIYQIVPTGASAAREAVLYSFGTQQFDGIPSAGCSVIQSSSGAALLGTTDSGGTGGTAGGGTLFELDPPNTPKKPWTERIDAFFVGVTRPEGLLLDVGGNLFGTLSNGDANGSQANYGAIYSLPDQ